VLRDGTFGIRGQRPGLVEGFIGAFYPNIARPFEGLNKRNELAVGRQLRASNFGITEQQLAID
jgi:hypothetical protein